MENILTIQPDGTLSGVVHFTADGSGNLTAVVYAKDNA